MNLRTNAKLYLSLIYLLAALCGAGALAEGGSDGWRFALYLLMAVVASVLKITLPGVMGTLSVNYVFILIGVLELSALEAMLIAAAAALVQSLWRPQRKPRLVQTAFNVASLVLAATAAHACYHASHLAQLGTPQVIRLCLSAAVYFAVNTSSAALGIALTGRKSAFAVWRRCYFWSFPYYLGGASVAELLFLADFHVGVEFTIAGLAVLCLVYHACRLYLTNLDKEKRHAEEIANLHLRTIEALALAIEAKDENTHQRLRRVQHYAVQLGREMKLAEVELKALQAAAILHDIGKLAVPDYIISKPGRLTAEEFEKIKIHPAVGADILDRVGFPYPVAPIVRAHHERWDGSGYPLGLQGEAIPLGARILSAVDCLDALASDRQYRAALTLDEAMALVEAEAGRAYDPRVVECLKAHYREWETSLDSLPTPPPAASALVPEQPAGAATGSFLTSIAAARQEVQTIYEIAQDLAASEHLEETLAVLANHLRGLVPFDALVIYHAEDGHLAPLFLSGSDHRLSAGARIPLGQGLSGWVAQHQKPLLNGDPSVEPGGSNDASPILRSALAVPLTGANQFRGVLTAYHSGQEAFTKDHLRIFLSLSSKVSAALENSLALQRARKAAATDGLTGLPNASSLFLHLDAELLRAKREHRPLGVLMCDLDGFKRVNDQLGHLEGNNLLRAVAGALRASCREYDYVARMGGDEFVLIIPGASEEDLPQRIAALDQAVRAAAASVAGGCDVGLSVGDAYYPQHGADAESLLAEADQRMYQAKRRRQALAATSPSAGQLRALAAHMA
ncbi:MAG: diguanylate cyclase [Bryobacteraceae bacterium]|nr:diguanylate cyclase [Bryobacteraceae bacterium]